VLRARCFSQFARSFKDYQSQHDQSEVQVNAMQLPEQPEGALDSTNYLPCSTTTGHSYTIQ
jgi:hypothetical protein